MKTHFSVPVTMASSDEAPVRLRRLVGVTLVLFALALAGPAVAGTPCGSDSDCGIGEICVQTATCACEDPDDCGPCPGECVADEGSQACESNDDCLPGESCVALPCTCSSDEPECDTDCGSYCVDLGGDGGCVTDADCPDGQVCLATPCACPPDDPECGVECGNVCADMGGGGGVGGECESDADCPTNFRCEAVPVGCGGAAPACLPCACPPCEPGAECPPCDCPPCEVPEEIPCDPTDVVGLCLYAPPECESNADCADGFECRAEEMCMGGGSACACPGCAAGEECPPCECEDVPTEPECVVTGHYCMPADIPCESDADCPAEFTCEALPSAWLCADCACPPCPPEGECPPCECPPCEEDEPGEQRCLPSGWMVGADYRAGDALDDASGPGGGEATQDPNPAEPPVAPGTADDKDLSAQPGTGCTVGATHPAGALSLALLALLLGAFVTRRRACGLRPPASGQV